GGSLRGRRHSGGHGGGGQQRPPAARQADVTAAGHGRSVHVRASTFWMNGSHRPDGHGRLRTILRQGKPASYNFGRVNYKYSPWPHARQDRNAASSALEGPVAGPRRVTDNAAAPLALRTAS